jgi:hypothetical protein
MERRSTRGRWALWMLLLPLAGCYKDTAEPPDQPNTGLVRVAPAMRYGALPFALHQGYLYGPGSHIHFTRAHVLLSDFRLATPGGQLMGEGGDAVLLIAPHAPVVDLGMMPAGAQGALHFRMGVPPPLDHAPPHGVPGPLGDTAMVVNGDPAAGRYIMRLEGFVDLDGDGVLTPGVDTVFSYRPHGIVPAMTGAVNGAPADMLVPGGALTRTITLDVMDLLVGIDVLGRPTAQGADSLARQLVWNLAVALR